MSEKRVLIINSGCLRVNCSANLCHIAYIQGFVDLGMDVTVLSKSSKGQVIDQSLKLPDGVRYFEVDGSFLAARFGNSVKSNVYAQNSKKSIKSEIAQLINLMVYKVYGVMGISVAWIKNASRSFRDSQEYDLVLTLSGPVSSHLAGVRLIECKNIAGRCFCELWEDPWQYDLFNEKVDPEKLKMEEELTNYADCVLYVSPITLKIQKELFKSSASKMDWLPLPYYYKDDRNESFEAHTYGYFGDYYPNSRNIIPFYETAKELGLYVNICGNPSDLLSPIDNIYIHPRVSLKELKEYENKTNVLVFVCNLRGGQIPGKIYQYAATKKKVLFILDGTEEERKILREYFGQFNRFYFCENNVSSIRKTVLELQDNNTVRNEPVEVFSPSGIANDILYKCGLLDIDEDK